MKHQQIYNLEEFANKYQLTDIFGAYAAYLSVGVTLPTGVDVLHHSRKWCNSAHSSPNSCSSGKAQPP